MILKKDKRKRKHSLEETKNDEASCANDKYVAYVKKSSKKKESKKSKKEAQSLTNNTGSIEDLSEKKAKRKKKLKNKTEAIDDIINENKVIAIAESCVSISAKPKINKAAIKLNADLSNNGKVTKKSKKKKSSLKKIERLKKHKNLPGSSTDLEIITQINIEPTVDGDQLNVDGLQIKSTVLDIPLPDDDLGSENLPVIVEANLKKSSNSYIPKMLQDNKEIVKTYEVVADKLLKSDKIVKNKLTANSNNLLGTNQDFKYEVTKVSQDQKEIVKKNEISTDKSIKKKSEAISIINKSTVATNNSIKITEDLHSDIPEALQTFYNEVTRGFEALTEKLPKTNKNIEKESILTIDKSVTDTNSLIEIAHKNTAFLDNSTSINQGNLAQFFSLENKVILVLAPQTQFSFLGKLKLKVLYGAVELYGYVFDPKNTVKPVEVYSPRGYSSISISTYNLEDTYDKEALWDVLMSEGVDRSLKTKLHNAIQECKDEWSVLLLENLENTLTSFLNNHCSFKLFPKIENLKYPWCDPRRAEYVTQANYQFYNSENEISLHPQWNKAVTKQLVDQWISTKSVCALIAGGKGVGKSTTARYLINNLLRHSKKVILLDLDPGQAELTPAACVSLSIVDAPLLGPNFTHLKTPFYQLYLEDINVSNCITRYFECSKKLIECLKSRNDLKQYPVIVNTMGFCRGIGLDICIFLIKLIEPNNVIQILSKRSRNNFDFALLKQSINERKTFSISLEGEKEIFEKICDYELHYVRSMAEGKRQFDTWNMEPRQQRELVLLSYLSQIIQNADDKSFSNFTSNSINNIVPYALPFSSCYISLIKSSISPTHILAAMNGNIVALCGIDLDDETPKDKESLKYPLVLIKPPPCTCYGYGIVRGIDMNRCCIYINTPLSAKLLRHVNLLAGCSPMPFSLLHSGERVNAPYAGDRGELPTSREARRGYFRVDQNKTS